MLSRNLNDMLLAVVCDTDGVILEILRDDLKLRIALCETRLNKIVDGDSGAKADAFLAMVNARLVAFDWEMNMEVSGELHSTFFAGRKIGDRILVVAAPDRRAIARYFEQTSTRESITANYTFNAVTRSQPESVIPEESCYEDLTRLTNELTAVQRELAKKNVQLEQAVRELELFSSSVSHDLRAPIRAINLLSAILLEDHTEELSDEAKRHLQTMRRKAEQMAAMLDALLNLARQSKRPIKPETFNPKTLVDEILEDLQPEKRDRDVEISYGQLPDARGDRVLVKQVLMNLFSNAIKYSSTKPKSVLHFGSKSHNGKQAYFLSDNGIGFSERQAHRLFGIFERLHHGTEFTGTGVGLTLAKQIVERHGGQIWAESVEGEGSTFYFTLK